jgi:hypothetical protein
MVVHTRAPDVIEARAGVFEFLLINHPLDCPVTRVANALSRTFRTPSDPTRAGWTCLAGRSTGKVSKPTSTSGRR